MPNPSHPKPNGAKVADAAAPNAVPAAPRGRGTIRSGLAQGEEMELDEVEVNEQSADDSEEVSGTVERGAREWRRGVNEPEDEDDWEGAGLEQAAGTVAGFDPERRVFTLGDGATYTLDADANVEGLQDGATIVVTFRRSDRGNLVSDWQAGHRVPRHS